jgi:hypothetical protein
MGNKKGKGHVMSGYKSRGGAQSATLYLNESQAKWFNKCWIDEYTLQVNP